MKIDVAKLERADIEPADKKAPDPVLEKLLEQANQNADAIEQLADRMPEAVRVTERRVLTVQMPQNAPWRALTLESGPTNLGAPWANAEVLMQPGGLVRLRGRIDANAGAPLDIATLPSDCVPEKQLSHVGDSTDGVSLIRIDDGGIISLFFCSGTTEYVDLDGITFIARGPCAAPYRFTGTGWPMKVKHDLGKVTGLVLDAARRKGTPSTPVANEACGAPYVDWEDLGDGQVLIHAIWGLQWGRLYDVRVVLSNEE